MNTKEKLMGVPFAPAAPHVTILGAGASKALFSSGDRDHKLILLMDQIPSILGSRWQELVADANLPVADLV